MHFFLFAQYGLVYYQKQMLEESGQVMAATASIAVAVANLALVIFALLKCQGVIRLMFAVKGCLLVGCCALQSGCAFLYGDISSRSQINHNNTPSVDEFEVPSDWRVEGCATSVRSCYLSCEFVSPAFLHEIYVCSCKTERRERGAMLVATLWKLLATLLAVIAIVIADFSFRFVSFRYLIGVDGEQNEMAHAVHGIHAPTEAVTSIAIFGVMSYFNYHAAVAIVNGILFAKRNGHRPDKQRQFFLSMIAIIWLSQFFRGTLRVAGCVLNAKSMYVAVEGVEQEQLNLLWMGLPISMPVSQFIELFCCQLSVIYREVKSKCCKK